MRAAVLPLAPCAPGDAHYVPGRPQTWSTTHFAAHVGDVDYRDFEAGATNWGGGNGWAAVWCKGHFAFKYK